MKCALTLIFLLFNAGVILSQNATSNKSDNTSFTRFYGEFITQLQSGKIFQIQYPLNLMCYADRSKGKLLDSAAVNNKRDLIFTSKVINKLSNQYQIEEQDDRQVVVSIGFTQWSNSAEMMIEYAFHYYFEYDDGWALTRVMCL